MRLSLLAVLLFAAQDSATEQAPPPIPPFSRPVLFNSADADKLIASVGPKRRIGYNLDMGFILVPPDQKPVDVAIKGYADESDRGHFPLPDGAPVEGWPLDKSDLETLQREGRGDRHVIVV